MSEGLATAPNWYWHKSAIPGISGIRTSPWRPGENCAFIGSTGTLEMLDRDGRLLRSYCQNWGAVNSFAFHTAPDGLRELFTGRAFCGAARVYRINNRDRDANISGFAELPAQDNVHHYGWEMLGRTHLFVRDLDGSGVPRLIGDVNGVFNLVAVWDLAGNPLYGVALGEGRKPPRFDRNSYGKFMLTPHHVRGMAVENITGVANRQEIILAHAGKTLVVFDHLLRKIWSAPLPADPVSLGVRPASGVTPGRILVGCEDGSLLCFSGEGRLLGQTRLLGAVTRIALCKDGFAAGSATGTIAFFPFF